MVATGGLSIPKIGATPFGYRLAEQFGIAIVPPKPALVAATEAETAIAAIELELWALPKSQWVDFLAGIPTPLGLGTVLLADGRRVKGFICEPGALVGARNIIEFGGWRAFIHSLNATAH